MRQQNRDRKTEAGAQELRDLRRRSRGLYWAAGLFSVFANLLMLTGPLYMLLVYDRVLTSRSVETLLALTILAAFLYLNMGVLDLVRGRILSRIGARFQATLDPRAYDAALRQSAIQRDPDADTALQDVEAIQRLLASPVPAALFDLPFTPLFLGAIALFHPLLGLMALGGGAVLIGVAALSRMRSQAPQKEALRAAITAQAQADQMRTEAGMIRAMGMGDAAFARWHRMRRRALTQQIMATDVTAGFSVLTRSLRLALQSGMLGLGAWLVLRGEVTGGAMISGSILLGRALTPIEMLISQWPLALRARQAWQNLARLLGAVPVIAPRTGLPHPKAHIEVVQATVIPPGHSMAALRMLTFSIGPGQALGVIGPSGAGKSTLARAMTAAWPCAGGCIRLDGASLEHYDATVRGQLIGYLPQRVELFEGTIAENIARMAEVPDDAAVVAAARAADAHDMILRMPEGYDTAVRPHGTRLSGGQIQRIGLARAMYGAPVLLVLDEPNSNLDNEGSEALNTAIRAMKAEGRAVMIMAHRPAAIQECDLLLMLEDGNRVAFGPRDDVLRKVVQNHDQIRRSAVQGGMQGGVQ
ncbi:type I secretion system permease/ATPase [Pseudooceanicola sediminis]|uniref:Type I secretion system permease/ATPase n=1 Tax=Pseudooceanicola sediminis TaxID=2211117 RepID=A0A399IWM3_9RHOB|nr:type I secretion system permease/ATPase [Pseudooceanicola sediminis]KAA2312547.1 type I secretion system permease/ATPase [Puniceibacterium sp. HSS470]RII37555.1 type I secretion system permease/ATPase [Pseudooceanicola sediminis]